MSAGRAEGAEQTHSLRGDEHVVSGVGSALVHAGESFPAGHCAPERRPLDRGPLPGDQDCRLAARLHLWSASCRVPLDLSFPPHWGIPRELERAGVIVLADKGYQGAEGPVITPYKGKNKPESRKQANRSHARLRGPGERANAQLKSWKILRKPRCSPSRAGHLVKAIAVLQNHRVAQAARG